MPSPVGAGSGLARRRVEKGFGEPGCWKMRAPGAGAGAGAGPGRGVEPRDLEQQGSESAPLRRSGGWSRAAS